MRYILSTITFFIISFSSVYATVWEKEVEQTASFITTILSLFSTDMLLKVVFAVIVIILTFVISKIITVRLFWYLESTSLGEEDGKEELIGVISRTVNIVILITGFSITLGILWVDLGIFMWGIWFGIGFTLRTFLTNFIAGIIMVTQWVYHSWDLIEVGKRLGNIMKINALFTSVQQLDGVMFYIPNIKFIEEEVKNFHSNDKRRMEIEFVVDYKTDIVKAKQILGKVVSNFPSILKTPSYDILVESLGDSGIIMKLRFWMYSKDKYIVLKSNITETINLWFEQAGIILPYKQIMVVNKK